MSPTPPTQVSWVHNPPQTLYTPTLGTLSQWGWGTGTTKAGFKPGPRVSRPLPQTPPLCLPALPARSPYSSEEVSGNCTHSHWLPLPHKPCGYFSSYQTVLGWSGPTSLSLIKYIATKSEEQPDKLVCNISIILHLPRINHKIDITPITSHTIK